MAADRSVLPARSPYPLTHPCTWVAPLPTAASELATAQPLSLWKCTPTWVSNPPSTSVTMRSTS